MTTISETRVARPTDRLHLRASRLPGWALPAAVLGAGLLTAGLFAVTDLSGAVGFLLVAVPLAIAAVTTVTAVVEGRRRAIDRLITAVVCGAFVLAVAPLVSVLVLTINQGLARLDGAFLTHSMRNVGARDAGGGAYHAILGTVQQVGIASALAIPLGLLTAVYLVEYGRGALARAVSFFVDVMTGLPSIVAGLFILAFWVLVLGRGFSGFAGALALSILMLPVLVRSAEEMLRLVPDELREASFALGIPRWKTILRVVIPTALPGIVTGIMLGVARVIGETAPLLLTVFGNASINPNPFEGPQSALPLFVFSEAGKPNDAAIDRAWAGALTLILLVMVLNLAARLLAARRSVRS